MRRKGHQYSSLSLGYKSILPPFNSVFLPSTWSSSGESGLLAAATGCVDMEQKFYTEGPRIPVGSSFTCSHSDLSRAHFSSSIVLVALGGLKTFLLHSPECSRTSGSGMVALFNSSLEWSLLLSVCPASPTRVFRHIWFCWMWSILSGTKPVVPAPVATILVRHWHSSKGTCSSCYSRSPVGPLVVRKACVFSLSMKQLSTQS